MNRHGRRWFREIGKGIAALVVLTGFAADGAEECVREIEPGRCYRLDAAWHEVNVPRSAMLHPLLIFKDADGKVFPRSGYIGQIQQRVFLPERPDVQVWRVFAIPEDGDAKTVGAAGFEGAATVRIPKGTRSLTLSLHRVGDPAEIDEVRLSIEPCEPPAHRRCRFPPLANVPELTDAELDAALRGRPRLVARTVTRGDRTEVEVDGRIIPLKIYKNCPWDAPQRYIAAKTFAGKGFNAFTLDLNLAKAWRKDGSADLSAFRTMLRKLLKRNPEAQVMVELAVRPRPDWGEENPDEVFRCEDGRYALFTHGRVIAFTDAPKDDPKRNAFAPPSYLSEKFVTEAAAVLGRAFAEMETWPETKNVIGVYMNGGTDGQWLDLFDNSALVRRESADYSVVSQRRFDAWRRAHGKEPVKIPPNAAFRVRDRVDFGEHAATPESDWREFYANAAVEGRLRLARAVKEATGRRLLVGSYSPQTGLAGSALTAQTAAWRLISSPDWDFFAVVPSYVREPWDPVVSAVYDASLVRHGKLFVSELDLRSGDVGNWGFWGSDLWRSTHTAATFREKAVHYACHALTRGGAYHAYDMDGGWFNTPEAQETWRIANAIADAAHPMAPTADAVAMVSGERFFDHRSQGLGHMLAYAMREMPRHALATAGVPYRLYLADDILADPAAELPKVVLFTDPTTLTAAQYREFKARYAKDGRVIVWFWRPGVYAADGAEIDADFGFRADSRGDNRWIMAPEEPADPLMKGVKGLFTAWYPYYYDGLIFPPAYVPDGWKALASFQGTDVPAVSMKRFGDHTEVHIANPGLIPQRFVRNLCEEAGFRALIETDDISGYGAGLFYILSVRDGVKRFRLPSGVTPGKVLYGPSYRAAETGYEVDLKRGRMFVLSVR